MHICLWFFLISFFFNEWRCLAEIVHRPFLVPFLTFSCLCWEQIEAGVQQTYAAITALTWEELCQRFTPLQSRWGPGRCISPSPSPFLQSFALARHSIWTQLGCVSWPFLSLPRGSPAHGVWQCHGPGRRQPRSAQPACRAAPKTWLHSDGRHCPCCPGFRSHHRLQSQHYKAVKWTCYSKTLSAKIAQDQSQW